MASQDAATSPRDSAPLYSNVCTFLDKSGLKDILWPSSCSILAFCLCISGLASLPAQAQSAKLIMHSIPANIPFFLPLCFIPAPLP